MEAENLAGKAISGTNAIFEIGLKHKTCDPNHCHCWDDMARIVVGLGNAAFEEGLAEGLK